MNMFSSTESAESRERPKAEIVRIVISRKSIVGTVLCISGGHVVNISQNILVNVSLGAKNGSRQRRSHKYRYSKHTIGIPRYHSIATKTPEKIPRGIPSVRNITRNIS